MDNESGGVGRLLSVTLVLLVAVGGLALLRFDVMGLRTWLIGSGESGHTPPPSGQPNQPRAGGAEPRDRAFDARTPSDESFRVSRPSPLPPTLKIRRKVASHEAELDLILVPQGWFPMGEDDGVKSNTPKRWVWCSDFYITTTEATNAQFFAFVLAGGYARSQFWTQAGWEFCTQAELSGTELVGWRPVDFGKRLWWLAAPGGDVTVDLRGTDTAPPRANAPVLLLPPGGVWVDYFRADATQGKVYIRARDTWVESDGDDVAKTALLKADGFLFNTGEDARVSLAGKELLGEYLVVAWPEGNKRPPVFGRISRTFTQSRLIDARMPVTGMSWFEADACARYWGGRLPWECWWEKAARGTDGRFFPWGNDLELNQRLPIAGRMGTPRANFNRNEVDLVGRYASGASPFGVHDMVGNVSEWVADAYLPFLLQDDRFEGPDPRHVGNPRDMRSERGSSTQDGDIQTARVYNRRVANPTMALQSRGFRIAFTAEEALKAAGR